MRISTLERPAAQNNFSDNKTYLDTISQTDIEREVTTTATQLPLGERATRLAFHNLPRAGGVEDGVGGGGGKKTGNGKGDGGKDYDDK